MIGQAGRGNLISYRIECFHKVNRGFVPDGHEPGDADFFGVCIDLTVLFETELHFPAVIQVGDVAPGCLPHHILLFGRRGNLRGAFLKFHRIHAGMVGSFHQLFGNFDIAVVVDADLRHNIHQMALSHPLIANFYRFRHK